MFAAKHFLTTEIGKANDVLSLFSSYGQEVPRIEAVIKWYQRDQIPAVWMLRLLCVLELDRGGPLSLARYWRSKRAG